ncbi:penicillin-binding protein 1A [Paracidovorax valerianellae]|uniref:Penicillin-binding protein 1A n=1 Tax=Paracidovorax valerianellae TaxID=187868 RepID=A0A1G7DSD4_9BURK|nr:transglycosylase domain-containing protein [Paracidovorax valerianellae]MDA8446714.1 transglycosylase domain-containing protein [Paracidovorax valerianellae]SDE54429.1 penicillin-binding protein 1A [Paracidovorax valerianellae]
MPPVLASLRARLAAFMALCLGRIAPPLRRASAFVGRHRSLRTVLWALAAVPVALLLYVVALVPFTPAISDIRKAKTEQPAHLVSADGRLLAEYKWVNREWVPLESIAPAVKDALIATEDHRFYDHFGLDWRRTASAVIRTLGGDKQGGSTITQQLARNLYPEDIGRAPTLTRKLKEAITALKIEVLYSKDEILETYLNTVPFLYNAYGIEMAARTYFDKSADKLTVLESATLIGMLKGTSYYNPVLNPERAQERRNTVLSQMKKRGKLSAEEYDTLSRRPLRIRFERQIETAGPAPHLAQQLRKQLIDWADRNGYSLYADGLVIRTTIDSRLQTLANQAVARQGRQLQGVADGAWASRNAWNPKGPLVQALVRESAQYEAAVAKGATPEDALKDLLDDAPFMRQLRQQKTRLQAGFLALDPRSGEVRAWVGSRDFAVDPFDHVQAARRQPGSTFKPFVYGAAFANGLLPTDTLMDEAVEIPLGGRQVWRPTDEGPPSNEPMTLADGLAFSKNTITAQVMQKVGPERVAQLARAMGVRESKLDVVPSLALGTSPVTLKEMVAAYGTIANGGQYRAPIVISRIEDKNGKVLEDFAPADPERAAGLGAVQALRDAMRGVIDKGTGVAVRTRYGITADVAGKTGTTQDNTDGWFILMHPQLVAGAWVGFNDGRITLRSDYWGQGAHSALPMVGEVFQQALRTKVIDARERFIDEEEKGGWVDNAVGGMRNWVYDLFGRRTGPAADAPPVPPGSAVPVPARPASDASAPLNPPEAPEITEAPLVPLQNATPEATPATAPMEEGAQNGSPSGAAFGGQQPAPTAPPAQASPQGAQFGGSPGSNAAAPAPSAAASAGGGLPFFIESKP